MNTRKILVAGAAISSFIAGSAAHATNGMLMEGYGPISHGMGGTSMAFDNGAAAMANNPATLGLMKEDNRFDAAFGILRPDVVFKTTRGNSESEATSFIMPAIGYVAKRDRLRYGIGVYSQGGMGVDFLKSNGMYSQIIIGKVILPVAYEVTDRLTLGATLEYIRAEMDLVMEPFNFKKGSDFRGAASGYGVSGKLGAVYKITDTTNIGLAYQHKGNIGDMTGNRATVKGMDMPATLGIGLASQITDKLLASVEYSRIYWSNSMKTVQISQYNPQYNMIIPMDMKQDWVDQNVFMVGMAYQVTPKFTLRAGVSLSNNPVRNMTPMFPATIKNHYTTGFGYRFNDSNSINMSVSYAPKVTRDNDGFPELNTSTSHRQTSAQFMYSHHF